MGCVQSSIIHLSRNHRNASGEKSVMGCSFIFSTAARLLSRKVRFPIVIFKKLVCF